MVKIDIEGCQIDFIQDTGVAISTVTTPTGQLTKDSITIIWPPETPRSTSSANPKNAWLVDTGSGMGFCMCQKLQVPFWEETYFLD
jgi:hypothetical protein